MHELSVCWALIAEVERLSQEAHEDSIAHIAIRVGELSGTDPGLLLRAFEVARSGTKAEHAYLTIERCDPRVRCTKCGLESATRPNRLLCAFCGSFRVKVIGGDELSIAAVEFAATDVPGTSDPPVAGGSPNLNTEKEAPHV
ncbi:hydrogenase maturation nickel metallochaperone HypA/HybF (plasmid) [Bradyrhizobium denitrificans]